MEHKGYVAPVRQNYRNYGGGQAQYVPSEWRTPGHFMAASLGVVPYALSGRRAIPVPVSYTRDVTTPPVGVAHRFREARIRGR